MISILIPVYNYRITHLVENLVDEAKDLSIPYEIILLDDKSTDKTISDNNLQFCNTKEVEYLISDTNLGNAKTRNLLARKAKYDWLLFIDADMLPANTDFLKQYIKAITNTNSLLICGNITYTKEKPETGILRWEYGRRHEEVPFSYRLKKPYLTFRLNCFMVHKSIYKQNPFPELKESYGYTDIVFASNFEKLGIKPLHIENPMYHMGLDNDEVFLRKTERAIANAANLFKNNPVDNHNIKILALYRKLKSTGLDYPISKLFKKYKNSLRDHLLSDNPNIKKFQLYKLGYLCELLASK